MAAGVEEDIVYAFPIEPPAVAEVYTTELPRVAVMPATVLSAERKDSAVPVEVPATNQSLPSRRVYGLLVVINIE
jgi:hypothetical protein